MPTLLSIIKYIPLQQGLRRLHIKRLANAFVIIKYIPLQQGLRLITLYVLLPIRPSIIKYIPLQQGLRLKRLKTLINVKIHY